MFETVEDMQNVLIRHIEWLQRCGLNTADIVTFWNSVLENPDCEYFIHEFMKIFVWVQSNKKSGTSGLALLKWVTEEITEKQWPQWMYRNGNLMLWSFSENTFDSKTKTKGDE